MLRKILVAFDGSEKSYEAFSYALEMSKLCTEAAPEIIVISVAQPPEPVDIVEIDAVIDAAKEHYGKLLRQLREKAKERNIEVKTEIVVGHPAEQIIRYAKENDIDQIIMGQKGKSKIESWLLGSVSKRVATYAPCTVTIVK
jgi:nucleotide-binding universal stress UspA family protein